MARERWKDIPGYEGYYQASTLGRIKSIDRLVPTTNRWGMASINKRRGVVLSGERNGRYLMVALCKKGLLVDKTVHRLIALTFIPNPNNKPEVNHKDCNKRNNKASNLEWVTRKENAIHAVINGMFPKRLGEKVGTAKLTDKKILKIFKRIEKGETQRSIAKQYQVSESLISMIKNRKIWGHVKLGVN